MIYVILGPDNFLAQTALRERLAELDPSQMSTTSLDGESATTQDVVTGIGTYDLFGSSRTVVLRSAFARNRKNKSDTEAATSGNAIDFKRVFEVAESGNNLILMDTVSRTVPTAINKSLPTSAQVITSEPPRGPALVKYAVNLANSKSSSISSQVAQHLLQVLFGSNWQSVNRNPAYDQPPDLLRLNHELEKLSLYCGSAGIDLESIDLLIPSTDDPQAFAFTDAVISGNRQNFLMSIEPAMHDADELSRLSNMALQQIELAVPLAAEGRPSDQEMAADLEVSNPKRLSVLANNSSRSPIPISERATSAVEVDRKLKTGRLRSPVDALYELNRD